MNSSNYIVASKTFSGFYFLLIYKPNKMIAGGQKQGKFFQVKRKLGTNGINRVREQGCRRKL